MEGPHTGPSEQTAMRRAAIPLVLALLVIVVSLITSRGRRARAPEPASPEDVIYAAFSASRAGATRAYLNCYGGKLRDSIEQAASEMGQAAFEAHLRETMAPVMGVAVSTAGAPSGATEQRGQAQVDCRVERVYQGRNEVQTYTLRKGRGGWKIEAIDGAVVIQPPVPYGTEAYPLSNAPAPPGPGRNAPQPLPEG